MAKRSYLRLLLWLLVMILVQIHAALWIARMDCETRSKEHPEEDISEIMEYARGIQQKFPL